MRLLPLRAVLVTAFACCVVVGLVGFATGHDLLWQVALSLAAIIAIAGFGAGDRNPPGTYS